VKKALFLSLLGLFPSCTASAQSNPTNATTLPHYGNVLTPEESQEVSKAHSAALFASPRLNDEERKLWGEFRAARDSGQRPSPDVMAELRDYNAKLRAAMIQADPNVEPVLVKLEAAQAHPAGQ
jgi:hypothetical protein